MINRRAFLQLLASVPLAAKFFPSLAAPFRVGSLLTTVPPYREFIPGLKSIGPLTMTINAPAFLPKFGEKERMRIDFPDGHRYEFDGIVQQFFVSDSVDGLSTGQLTVQPTGEVTVVTGPEATHGLTLWNGQEVIDVSMPVYREMVDVTMGGI